eukprot:TRINITY_DN9309_c0_g1_i5.p1 TRINITY_DN9309_c0_g1~~TRINITY_DN9309_c0_g1_i5.p1  ORF type:complete len:353 (+),score=87.82 TRINITY_DN9309_c0_g1_i5:153-1211(+)
MCIRDRGLYLSEGWEMECTLNRDSFVDGQEAKVYYKLLEVAPSQTRKYTQYLGGTAYEVIKGKWSGKTFTANSQRVKGKFIDETPGEFRFVFSSDGGCDVFFSNTNASKGPDEMKMTLASLKALALLSPTTSTEYVAAPSEVLAPTEAEEPLNRTHTPDTPKAVDQDVSEEAIRQLQEIAQGVLNMDLSSAHAEAVLRHHGCDVKESVGFLQANSSAEELDKLLNAAPPGSPTAPVALERTKSYVQRMAKREHGYLVNQEGMGNKQAGILAIERAMGQRRDKSSIPKEELQEFGLRHLESEIEHLVTVKGKSREEATTVARFCAGLAKEAQVFNCVGSTEGLQAAEEKKEHQ